LYILVVLGMYLVVAPGVLAGGAQLRRLLPMVHIATVPALPLHHHVPLEHPALLNVLQQLPVPLLVLLLNLTDLRERLGNVVEPLLLRRLGEVRVQGPPLQLLTLGRRQQVLGSIPDLSSRVRGRDLHVAPLQVLEEHLGVLLLVTRRLQENSRNLLIPLPLRHAGEESVPVPGLALPGERLQEVPLGNRSLDLTHTTTFHTFFPPGNINTVPPITTTDLMRYTRTSIILRYAD